MSHTNDKSPKRGATAAFTLVELIISMSLSAIVIAGVLASFTFLGRNLTRLVNTRDQEAKSRSAVYLFSQDISVAAQVSSASDSSISLTIPTPSGTSTTVTYTYDATAGTLNRTGRTTPVLTNLTAFDFNYFNSTGNPVPVSSSPLSVKEVELTFTSMTGTPDKGTQARYTAVSPRLLLRNKPLLR